MHLQIMKYHDLINDFLVKVCCVRLRDCKKERKYYEDQYSKSIQAINKLINQSIKKKNGIEKKMKTIYTEV